MRAVRKIEPLRIALHCYPKTKTNMFVIASKYQAAIFNVWSVDSISR